MKKVIAVALACLTFALTSAVQAQDFQVTGVGATGKAGDRVFLNLSYDYGAGFRVVAEDFSFQYDAALSYVPTASTIDLYAPGKTIPEHITFVGGVMENPLPTSYALSYASTVGQFRSGVVHVAVAFDIAAGTAPGAYAVAFSGMISDGANEFAYPADLSLNVNVITAVTQVPEPGIALMLVSGLALVGTVARRRKTAPA